MKKINGVEVGDDIFFAYDGDYRFFLLADLDEQREAKGLDYEILPIEILPETWRNCKHKDKCIDCWSIGMKLVHEPYAKEDPIFEGFETPEEIEWKAYLQYLVDWTMEYKGTDFYGLSPLCFDDWRLEQEDKNNG